MQTSWQVICRQLLCELRWSTASISVNFHQENSCIFKSANSSTYPLSCFRASAYSVPLYIVLAIAVLIGRATQSCLDWGCFPAGLVEVAPTSGGVEVGLVLVGNTTRLGDRVGLWERAVCVPLGGNTTRLGDRVGLWERAVSVLLGGNTTGYAKMAYFAYCFINTPI